MEKRKKNNIKNDNKKQYLLSAINIQIINFNGNKYIKKSPLSHNKNKSIGISSSIKLDKHNDKKPNGDKFQKYINPNKSKKFPYIKSNNLNYDLSKYESIIYNNNNKYINKKEDINLDNKCLKNEGLDIKGTEKIERNEKIKKIEIKESFKQIDSIYGDPFNKLNNAFYIPYTSYDNDYKDNDYKDNDYKYNDYKDNDYKDNDLEDTVYYIINHHDYNHENINNNNIIPDPNHPLDFEKIPLSDHIDKENNRNILIEKKIDNLYDLEEEYKYCYLCYDKFAIHDKIIILPCYHYLHKSCIFDWFEIYSTCPICNLDFNHI
jgi:hypothetical protein